MEADRALPDSRKRPGSPTNERPAAQRARATAQQAPTNQHNLVDAPLHLLRVRAGIPAWANEGFLGFNLQDAIAPGFTWALIANFYVDFPWLLSAAPALLEADRLVLVHGHGHGDQGYRILQEIEMAGIADKTVTHCPPLPEYGTHHTKAFLLRYPRGLRVIIHTANALYQDFNNKSQGAFIQDFPLKDDQSAASSPFERDLLAYFDELRLPPVLQQQTRAFISLHDFSAARAHLIASVPGEHFGNKMHAWGHLKLRACLESEAGGFESRFVSAPVLANYSSVGNLSAKWLENFRDTLCAGKSREGRALGVPNGLGLAGLHLVWPTVDEVRHSVEGWHAGGSIPSRTKSVTKAFLTPLYHKWGGAAAGRQRAMPHLKSYVRFVKDPEGGEEVELAYACFTSHNLSKAAWGEQQQSKKYGRSQLRIWSFELGVLVTPATELGYRNSRWCGFSATKSDGARGGGPSKFPPSPIRRVRLVQWRRGQPQTATMEAEGVLKVPVPLPYQLPPEKYDVSSGQDIPWSMHEEGGGWPGDDILGFPYPGWGRAYGMLERMEWADILNVA